MQVLDSTANTAAQPDAEPVLCDATITAPPKRLEELVREACAVRRYSRRTFQAYWHWCKRFILWSGKRHPKDMGQIEVGAFLTWLATEQRVSASTQRQALHGILFMYQAALGIPIKFRCRAGQHSARRQAEKAQGPSAHHPPASPEGRLRTRPRCRIRGPARDRTEGRDGRAACHQQEHHPPQR